MPSARAGNVIANQHGASACRGDQRSAADIDRAREVAGHVHRAGGIMAILGELDRGGLIHHDVPTVHSPTLGDALDSWDVCRTKDEAVHKFYMAAPGRVSAISFRELANAPIAPAPSAAPRSTSRGETRDMIWEFVPIPMMPDRYVMPIKKAKGQARLDAADQLWSTAVSRVRQPIESLFNWIECE